MSGFVAQWLVALLLSVTCVLGIVPGARAQAPCTPPSCSNCPSSEESGFDERIVLSPANNDPDLPPEFELAYQMVARDGSGDPIEDLWAVGLDWSYGNCHPPTNIIPDNTSGPDGVLFWSGNLPSGPNPRKSALRVGWGNKNA
jgi:hypothetical protein